MPDGSYVFRNNNRMLRTYDGIVGGKTGYDDDAGWCLINVAERDGRRVIAVTMNGVAPDDWYDDNRVLLDYALEQQALRAETGAGVTGEVVRFRDPDAADHPGHGLCRRRDREPAAEGGARAAPAVVAATRLAVPAEHGRQRSRLDRRGSVLPPPDRGARVLDLAFSLAAGAGRGRTFSGGEPATAPASAQSWSRPRRPVIDTSGATLSILHPSIDAQRR